jgi:hypothetical protein
MSTKAITKLFPSHTMTSRLGSKKISPLSSRSTSKLLGYEHRLLVFIAVNEDQAFAP